MLGLQVPPGPGRIRFVINKMWAKVSMQVRIISILWGLTIQFGWSMGFVETWNKPRLGIPKLDCRMAWARKVGRQEVSWKHWLQSTRTHTLH
jgi:hypothetical protein